MAFRLDIGALRPPVVLPGGRIRVDGRISRTGVFVYRNADGSDRREYRPPEEVFKEDTLASFSFAPVTDNHPPEMVTAENAKSYTVGTLGEAVRSDGERYVEAPIVVHDATTIGKMRGGKVELSCGYECELEMTPGVSPEGEHYDAIQRNIRGNHVALVDVGRAGPTVRVRMDDAAYMIENERREDANSNTEIEAMDELKKQLDAALAAQAQEKARADQAEAKAKQLETQLSDATKRADTAEGERDSLRTDNDKLKQDAADKDASFDVRVNARAELVAKAKSVLGEEFRSDASDLELKKQVVKKLDGTDIPDEKKDSVDYIDARYDMAIAKTDTGADALAAARAAMIPAGGAAPRNDAGDEKAARAAMLENIRKRSPGYVAPSA